MELLAHEHPNKVAPRSPSLCEDIHPLTRMTEHEDEEAAVQKMQKSKAQPGACWTGMLMLLYGIGTVVMVLRVRGMFSPSPHCGSCDKYDEAEPCTMNNSKIPRIIHQSYKTADLP